MRAEVKAGLIVAFVVFAGGAIWLLSRKSDKLDSLPISKAETEAAGGGSVKLAPEPTPFAQVPERPRNAPATTPDHRRATPPPARRQPLAGRAKTADHKPTDTTPSPGAITHTGRPAAEPPIAEVPPAGPLAQPLSPPSAGPLTKPAPSGTPAATPRAAEPAPKTTAGTAPAKLPAVPPAKGIKTADTKLPTIIPPRKRSPLAPEPGRVGASPATGSTRYKTYTVEPGDRLIDIARDEYGDGKLWKAIVAANPDLEDPDRLLVGQKLKLPPLEQARRLLHPGASAEIAKPALRPTAQPGGAKTKPTAGTTYVVGPGDSLIKIARNVLGDASRWKEIYEMNRDELDSPDLIVPGMKLRLPAKKNTTKSTTP